MNDKDREVAVVIKASDEVSGPMGRAAAAASRLKESFESVNAAQAKNASGAAGLEGHYSKVSAAFNTLANGIGRAGGAFGGTLFRGAQDLDAGYSKLAQAYLDRLEKFLSEPRGMGASAAAENAFNGQDTAQNPALQYRGASYGAYLSEKERFYNESLRMEAAHQDEQRRLDSETWDYKLKNAGVAAGGIANTLQNLYSVTGKKNRAMFETMKAFAIAETIIQTYRAAMSAYAALAPIPIVGPALGAAAAAAAVAAGMARVNSIRQTNPDGASGTISPRGTANPSYEGGSPSAYPVPQRLEDGGLKQTQYITITITITINNPLSEQNWQRLVEDNIVPALNNASERNIAVTVRSAS